MIKEELSEASLIVYTTDGAVDSFRAGEWSHYDVVDNYLVIKQSIGAEKFLRAIYNMNYVEKVVVSI